MKIAEIVIYPDRTESMEKYNQYFKDATTSSAFGDLILYKSTNSDEDFIGLFEKTQLVAVLHLNIREHGMWQITYTQTALDWQGQGCFRYLLTSAVATHGIVLSDDHQTQASKEAWKSLIKYPGPNLEIFVYDVDTKNKIPSFDVPDNEIWNNKSNPILLITNRSSISDRSRVMTRLKEKTGIDRTTDGIWYGPNSSTDTYINP